MSTDDKARKLLMDAWVYFWNYADAPAYWERYIEDGDELTAVEAHAEKIIGGTD